jgi:cell division protein FtsI/penicillin-binding protein 2
MLLLLSDKELLLLPSLLFALWQLLGNGGYLVTPHLASAIQYEDGSVKEILHPKGAQVIRPETSEEISRMLTTVVDDALGKGKYKMEHHTIGAKTGTAQIADPGGGGYYEDKYLTLFFRLFSSL